MLIVPSAAQAKSRSGVPAKLRVVAGQKVLADTTMRAGTTAVPTSRAARCFGPGKRGSGKSKRVAGPTPLGLLTRAARAHRSLRPLRLTDAFSFGLGLCAVGGVEAKGSAFWQLRVNHRAAKLGGDAVRLKRGATVLWYLKPDFEGSVEELWLTAPRRVAPGSPFGVRVFAFDEAGKRKPAGGVEVTGARRPTNAKGFTLVRLNRSRRLIARDSDYIPSNRAAVCVGGKCPRG
jgi:hypothetical protein